MKQKIIIAHSPDSDDAFMFYALATGKLTSDKYTFEVIREDIEALNHLAQKEKYDITAISFHAYAYVADKYVLTTSGASFAEKDYGPIVVSKNPLPFGERADPVASRGGERGTIAIPGTLTTAALLLKIAMPQATTIAMPFDKIIDAVLNDEVDAGLLIHEGQLQYEKFGLKKILSLTDHWSLLTPRLCSGHAANCSLPTAHCPLPLGGTAIRRSLDVHTVHELSIIVQNSIRYAIEHSEEARDYAMQFKRDLSTKEADKYLSWYANERSLNMGEEGKKSVQLLLDCALERGLISQPIKVTFV